MSTSEPRPPADGTQTGPPNPPAPRVEGCTARTRSAIALGAGTVAAVGATAAVVVRLVS